MKLPAVEKTRRDAAAVVQATMTRACIAADESPEQRIGLAATVLAAHPEFPVDQLPALSIAQRDEPGGSELLFLETLGEGGMGVVELAEQRTLERPVAVKRLKGNSADPDQVHALLAEARIAGRLEHPNIVPVHALGMSRVQGPLVVMRRVEGEEWSAALTRDRHAMLSDPPVLERHLRVLMQVCNAVHFAHSRGIVHRDIKPANVMLGAFGEVYLLDWGIAIRLGASEESVCAVAGTPLYMAPEMVRGSLAQIDATTDVYLLGATLHEVLVGTQRHRAGGLSECFIHALLSQPEHYADTVSPELAAICNRACHAQREQRFGTAEALRDALGDYLERRDARVLVAASKRLIEHDNSSKEYQRRALRLVEARFGLEQALRVRPGLEEALSARKTCLLAMVRHELAHGNAQSARLHAAELGNELPDDLRQEVDQLGKKQQRAGARLAALERDIDPEVARASRLRVATIVLAVLTLMNIVALYTNPTPGLDISPTRILLFGLFPPLVGIPILLVFRKRLQATQPDRLYARLCLSVFLAVPVSRGVGLAADWTAPNILLLETLVIAGILFNTAAPLRCFRVMGVVSALAAFAGAVEPQLIRYLHLLVTWIVVLLATLELRIGRPRADNNKATQTGP